MSKQRKTVAKRAKVADHRELPAYGDLVGGIAEVLEAARRIVEHEQGGKERAEYRTVLPDEKLIAADLQKTQRMLERRGTAERGEQQQ